MNKTIEYNDASSGTIGPRELQSMTVEETMRARERLLVGKMVSKLNVARESVESEVTRVLQCPHCDRAIVEYGSVSLPTKHSKGLPEDILARLEERGVQLIAQPCIHHGGNEYVPVDHLKISV